MLRKRIVIFFSIILCLLILFILNYEKFLKKNNTKKIETETPIEIPYSSNIIENVSYSTKDADGNEYIINALQGEIDYSKPDIIYLTEVRGTVKLRDSDYIIITSKFGKYNTDNFDTIFSKNVIIKYLDNKIKGEYLDFSLKRNSMIISKDVTYNNNKNVLYADVIEINIQTKDTKIFMYEKDKKVNIKSKN
tara:strand:+ start:859 stop:1434 length:576 start_codon:yes stop_codon:yes gene_type:complete